MVLLDARGHAMCGLHETQEPLCRVPVGMLLDQSLHRNRIGTNRQLGEALEERAARSLVPPRLAAVISAFRVLSHEVSVSFARHVQPADRLADEERGAVVAQKFERVACAHAAPPKSFVTWSRRSDSFPSRDPSRHRRLAFMMIATPQPEVRLAEKPYSVI